MVCSFSYPAGERWYCLRSKPKKERIAAGVLMERYSLEVFCPQVRFRRKTVNGAKWFQEALFPGYLFARFDFKEMHRAVSHSCGILCVPTFGGRVIPVPDDFVESLRADMDGGECADAREPLKPGDETTVLDGSLRGLKVKVIKLLPAGERVAVLVDLLGNLVEAEFPVDALEHRRGHPLAAGG